MKNGLIIISLFVKIIEFKYLKDFMWNCLRYINCNKIGGVRFSYGYLLLILIWEYNYEYLVRFVFGKLKG